MNRRDAPLHPHPASQPLAPLGITWPNAIPQPHPLPWLGAGEGGEHGEQDREAEWGRLEAPRCPSAFVTVYAKHGTGLPAPKPSWFKPPGPANMHQVHAVPGNY